LGAPRPCPRNPPVRALPARLPLPAAILGSYSITKKEMKMKKQWIATALAISLLALSTLRVHAGGWTVVTLDTLPQQWQAGQTATLGFSVRQHGVHPVNLDQVMIHATPTAGGQRLVFTASQEGEIGHYQVAIALPTAGEWQWEVHPGGFPPVALVPLTVVPAPTTAVLMPQWQQWIFQGTRVLVAYQPPLLVGGLRIAAVLATLHWPGAQSTVPTAAETDTVAYGRALFAAKGCTSCHLHQDVNAGWSTEVGPNLTDYINSSDYLHRWLTDPKAVKPTTAMPNLGLKEQEITALVAFLTDAAP